jgi:rod shape-determining protein MreD
MRWLKFAVLVIIATIVQEGLADIFTIAETKPDIMLILLVFFAVYSEPRDAIITSFVIGFAADLIGITMGANMLSFGITGTLLAQLHRFIAIRIMLVQGIAIFAVGIVCAIITYFLLGLQGLASAVTFNNMLIAQPIYSAVLGPFLFLPVAWWMRVDMKSFSKA